MKTQLFKAPDISCDHCERAIQKALGAVPGVNRVEVDISTQEVRVDYDEGKVERPALEAVLKEEGYPVLPESSAPSAAGRDMEGGASCCGSCHL